MNRQQMAVGAVVAGPGFDPNVENDAFAHVVTATGSDGDRATVAWGELDA